MNSIYIAIIFVMVVSLTLLAAYRIYFKTLFAEVKHSFEVNAKYNKLLKAKSKSILPITEAQSYKEYLESTAYRCSINYVEQNVNKYPVIKSTHSIKEKGVVRGMMSNFGLKALADVKIAENFKTDDFKKYSYRFDEGNLIISDNEKLNRYVNSILNDEIK